MRNSFCTSLRNYIKIVCDFYSKRKKFYAQLLHDFRAKKMRLETLPHKNKGYRSSIHLCTKSTLSVKKMAANPFFWTELSDRNSRRRLFPSEVITWHKSINQSINQILLATLTTMLMYWFNNNRNNDTNNCNNNR